MHTLVAVLTYMDVTGYTAAVLSRVRESLKIQRIFSFISFHWLELWFLWVCGSL